MDEKGQLIFDASKFPSFKLINRKAIFQMFENGMQIRKIYLSYDRITQVYLNQITDMPHVTIKYINKSGREKKILVQASLMMDFHTFKKIICKRVDKINYIEEKYW